MTKFRRTLAITTVLVGVAGPARADDRPRPVTAAAVCEAMLNIAVPAPATDTLRTLGQVRAYLTTKHPAPRIDDAEFAALADLDVATSLGRLASAFVPDGISQRTVVEARLAQIERDLRAGPNEVSFVAREFEGADVVDRERRAVLDRAVRTNEAMERHLPALYPRPNRIGHLASVGTVVMTAPAAAFLAVGANPNGLLLAPVLGAGVLGVRVGVRAVKRALSLSQSLAKHTREIGWRVHGPGPAFAMLGGSMQMPYALYRSLRDDVGTPIRGERAAGLARATEEAMRGSPTTPSVADRVLTRDVFYDSIFFVDENHRKRLLVIIRARQLPPGPPPTSPGVNRAPVRSADPTWEAAAAPAR